jgi:O-antigen/teichoic acid export membrane protein
MIDLVQLKGRAKAWLGPVWWYAVVMFVVQRVGDVINLYAGLWLIPKWVPQAELGALLPLTQIGSLLGLPLAIILTPFTKFINAFGAKEEYGKVKALLTDAFLLAGASALVIGSYTWVSAPHVFQRLRIDQRGILWLLCAMSVTAIIMPILNSALQALKQFRCMSVIGLVAAPARLVVLLLLLPVSGLLGYFGAQVVLYAASIGIGFWGLRRALSSGVRRASYFGNLKEMALYMVPVAVLMSVGSVSTTVQYFVIRQRLPDVESAAFYFCSRFAEIPNMLWSAVAIAFFPLVSEAFEKGKSTSRILGQSLAFTVLGGGVVAAVLGGGIQYLFAWVEKWRDYQPYAYLVIWMALANVLRVAFACFSTHEMACRRFTFIFYAVPLTILESVVLVSLTGYGFFESYLPASWVAWMASLRAARLEFIVGVMFGIAVAQFLGVAAHLALRARTGARGAGCGG